MTSRPPTAVTTLLAFDAGGVERSADRVGDDAGVHHFAFDDCVGRKRGDCDFDQLGRALAMIDNGDLDQARSNVEPYCRLPATK